MKPVGLSASRGVIRADDADGVRAAATRVHDMVDCALLIEEYVPGDEVAVEGLLRDGALEVLAIFDKPDPLVGPYFEETIYVTPSRHPDDTQARIGEITARAAAALGLTEGPVHAELRIDGEQIWVIEIAARSIGGLCARALTFGAGISLEEVILRHALAAPARRHHARDRRVGRDDAADPTRRCAPGGRRTGRGARGPRRHRPRDHGADAAGASCRCPRATATSASCSRAPTHRKRSRPRCAPGTPRSTSP